MVTVCLGGRAMSKIMFFLGRPKLCSSNNQKGLNNQHNPLITKETFWITCIQTIETPAVDIFINVQMGHVRM